MAASIWNPYTTVVNAGPCASICVKDAPYNAKGDGVTDDSAAIQAALDVGGAIYFPKGDYFLKSQVVLTQPYTALLGDGSNLSRLVLSSVDNTAGCLKLVAENTSVASEWISDINFKGISILSDRVMPTADTVILLHIVNGYRIRGEDVEVRGGYRNVVFEGGATQHWTNLYVFADGFSYDSPCESCVEFKSFTRADAYTQIPAEYSISNFTFRTGSGVQGNVNYALKITAADGLWFSNGVTSFSKVTNVYITTDTTNLNWLYFNNVFSDCGGTPNFTPTAWHIYSPGVYNIQGLQFANCTSRASTSYGFRIESTTLAKISAVSVIGHLVSLYKGIGVHVSGLLHGVLDFMLSPPFEAATDGAVVTNSNYYEIRGLVNNQFGYVETPKTIPVSDTQIDNLYVATALQPGYSDSATSSWVVRRLQLRSGGMASDDPNTFDRYAESTFVPGVNVGATAQASFTTQAGRLTQIGDTVVVSIDIVLSALTGTGAVVVTGLPVVFGSKTALAVSASSLAAGVGTADITAIGFTGGSAVNLYKRVSGSLQQLLDTDVSSAASITLTGIYHR